MPITQTEVYALTAKGSHELKGGATALTTQELGLVVLIDGRRDVAAIAELAKLDDPSKLESLLDTLQRRGFIGIAEPAASADGSLEYFFSARPSLHESSQPASASVAREAASGASTLRDTGYYVSIARRARARATSGELTVLIVEDEPLVAKYLKALVEMEGFIARLASNREEIVAQLREPPVPDLVILDVNLPDTNGFEVLERMRSYPLFAEVPVVMVTTQATRESVMKGLALGADGYITKPFDVDILVRGLKAVLGLLPPAAGALIPARLPGWKESDSRGETGNAIDRERATVGR
jgi:two-component system OmpR family response regulator